MQTVTLCDGENGSPTVADTTMKIFLTDAAEKIVSLCQLIFMEPPYSHSSRIAFTYVFLTDSLHCDPMQWTISYDYERVSMALRRVRISTCVDDCILSGHLSAIDEVIKEMKIKFSMKAAELNDFLGLNIEQQPNKITQ